MEKFIYLQRHGESETNIKKIFTCRKLNPSLTENGKNQIIKNVEYYGNKDITSIITSPSKRAVETATIISNDLKLKYRIDENLYEVDVGDMEGKSELADNNLNIFFEIINKWIYNKENASFPNGENLIDINKRIEYLIKKYFNINENIILVGHSVMFAILMSRFKIVKDIKKLFLKRGGIAKFSILKKEFEIPG